MTPAKMADINAAHTLMKAHRDRASMLQANLVLQQAALAVAPAGQVAKAAHELECLAIEVRIAAAVLRSSVARLQALMDEV